MATSLKTEWCVPCLLTLSGCSISAFEVPFAGKFGLCIMQLPFSFCIVVFVCILMTMTVFCVMKSFMFYKNVLSGSIPKKAFFLLLIVCVRKAWNLLCFRWFI